MPENKPNQTRRILAWISIILLVCLYVGTLFAAIFDHSADRHIFKLCIFCSLVFPLLIYAFLMLLRLRK
ncbi:MAG: hypothetical protein J6J86_05690 [Lachnospiraceae bacterium]|nr:hypothetical protein [Lachnospiraceae bacterium]